MAKKTMKTDKTLINLLKKFLSIGLFLGGLAILAFFWYPIYRWYMGLSFIPGVDFYLTATHVRQLMDNFNLPPLLWKYFWYSGYPFSLGYLIFHFYLLVPVVKLAGLIRGIQIYSMASLLFFLFSSYLLYFQVSKSRLLTAVLAAAITYSTGIYGSLLWAGAIPSFATQGFFPLSLFFLIGYFQKEKRNWLYLAGFSLGLALLGHPRLVLIYIGAVSFFFMALFPYGEGKFLLLRRVKDAFVLYTVAIFTSIIQTYPLLVSAITSLFAASKAVVTTAASTVGGSSSRKMDIFALRNSKMILAGTNQFIFLALGFFIVLFFLLLIIDRQRIKTLFVSLRQFLPTLVTVAFIIAYVLALNAGYPVPSGGWYRTFWPFPVVFGLLAAQFWGQSRQILIRIKPILGYALEAVLVLVALPLVFTYSKGVTDRLQVDTKFYIEEQFDVIWMSSVNKHGLYPSYIKEHFTNQELEDMKGELMPAWLQEAMKQTRLFELDPTVTVWWNAFFDIPQALGYIDPLLSFEAQGYWFWMKQALTKEGLIEDWEKSYKQAVNNAEFLIDWHGIGVIEAGCTYGRNFCIKISDYLLKENIVLDPVLVDFPHGESLQYYRVNPEIVSSILQPSNVVNILVISSDSGFEQIVRALAYNNVNSKKIILARDSEFIDKYSLNDLRGFQAVILYDYKYKNYTKVYSLLEKYVKEGGSLFVETSSDVKESESESLPELFPMEKTKWGYLGDDWDLEAGDFAKRLSLDEFSPPIYDEDQWKFSYVPDINDLDPEAKIILQNHGKPIILAKNYGQGKVIWSGMNLPYHLNRNDNYEEVKLFEEVLAQLTDFRDGDYDVRGNYEAVPGHGRSYIEGESAPQAILWREQAFPGWKAKITSGGRTKALRIYKAGPIIPGFIYVNVPEEMRGKPYKVSFNYRGDPQVWFFFIVNVIAILWVLEKGLIEGRGSKRVNKLLFSRLVQAMRKHWESEET